MDEVVVLAEAVELNRVQILPIHILAPQELQVKVILEVLAMKILAAQLHHQVV